MKNADYLDALPIPGLAIGSSVWIHDENRRVYREPARPGYSSGRPIVREHYRPGRIVGETRVSWLVRAEGFEYKLPKRTRVPRVAYSPEELDDLVFHEEHAWRIAEQVRACDPKTLRKIADILGYVPEEQG